MKSYNVQFMVLEQGHPIYCTFCSYNSPANLANISEYCSIQKETILKKLGVKIDEK
jgi:hypothetical protein